MGIPAPPPPVVGETCDHCDGTLWPAGVTPKFITLTAADLVVCPASGNPAPDGDYILTQNPDEPCHWLYAGPEIRWDILVDAAGYVEARGVGADAHRAYFGADWNNCDTHYDNLLVDCLFGNGARHGTVDLTF